MNIYNKVSAIVMTVLFTLGLVGLNVALAAGPAPVNLGAAGSFSVLSKAGISTTGVTSIVGNIGVSPAVATYITGFGLNLSDGSAFSTSPQVYGKVYAPDYAKPTPTNMTTAIGNMETAYTDAEGRTNPTATELGAGNIGGMTLAPGLYKWSSGVTIPTNVTLSGGANDVWIFQIAGTLGINPGKKVILSGGAQAKNIFWQVAGQTTLGTTSVFHGNILDQTAIVLNTGAVLNGRALAQTAVTIDSSSVTIPSASTAPAMAVATPAVPATPAIPATPAKATTTTDAGCLAGHKFSVTTGRNCSSATPAVPATPAKPATPAVGAVIHAVLAPSAKPETSSKTTATDAGCLVGHKFSVTTGHSCVSVDAKTKETPTPTSSATTKATHMGTVTTPPISLSKVVEKFKCIGAAGTTAQKTLNAGTAAYIQAVEAAHTAHAVALGKANPGATASQVEADAKAAESVFGESISRAAKTIDIITHDLWATFEATEKACKA